MSPDATTYLRGSFYLALPYTLTIVIASNISNSSFGSPFRARLISTEKSTRMCTVLHLPFLDTCVDRSRKDCVIDGVGIGLSSKFADISSNILPTGITNPLEYNTGIYKLGNGSRTRPWRGTEIGPWKRKLSQKGRDQGYKQQVMRKGGRN
jgi:hypothetical protein